MGNAGVVRRFLAQKEGPTRGGEPGQFLCSSKVEYSDAAAEQRGRDLSFLAIEAVPWVPLAPRRGGAGEKISRRASVCHRGNQTAQALRDGITAKMI
jgi:hypothetical protein